jgi:16S rRNA (guanine527-N7)-methyltransferase
LTPDIWLTQQLSTHGIELSNKQQQQFQTYYQMLVEWNEKYKNLSQLNHKNASNILHVLQ